jgi:sarcosine oxidase
VKFLETFCICDRVFVEKPRCTILLSPPFHCIEDRDNTRTVKTYDVIVLGLGGMGSAAAYHLAKSGARVLGIDQFAMLHGFGSSHGKRRLFRRAYFEHSDYVPLLNRSLELWRELEGATGSSLFHETGLLLMGPSEGSTLLPGTEASASIHHIPIELLSQEDVAGRFPQFQPPPDYRAILEMGAGYLEVEKCVEQHLRLAANLGAEIHVNERVARWSAQQKTVVVRTDRQVYEANRLVVAAGPWSKMLLEDLGLPLVVRRVPQFWFDAPPKYSRRAACPCFGIEFPNSFVYGFPSLDNEGLKMADHKAGVNGGVVDNPSAVDRAIHPEDLVSLREAIERCFSGVNPEPTSASVCLYTMTPDEHFIVDKHPKFPHVSFAAGFSGHGFKFSSVIGQALSELTLGGESSLPIGFLRLGAHREWKTT